MQIHNVGKPTYSITLNMQIIMGLKFDNYNWFKQNTKTLNKYLSNAAQYLIHYLNSINNALNCSLQESVVYSLTYCNYNSIFASQGYT